MAFTTLYDLSLAHGETMPFEPDKDEDKSYAATADFARSLKNSGSDIVAEEDLVGLFGRLRIDPKCEAAFRTQLSKKSVRISEELVLESGPGPTVQRALEAKDSAYLSTVISLSFLGWTHDLYDLTAAIEDIFWHQADEMPLEKASDGPYPDSITGVLRNCRDQTAMIRWLSQVDNITATIGLRPAGFNRWDGMSSLIFCGLLRMLPIVQRFPDSRVIYVETNNGICALVVWLHHILGLTVLLKHFDIPDRSTAVEIAMATTGDTAMSTEAEGFPFPQTSVTFGAGNPQVVLDMTSKHELIKMTEREGAEKVLYSSTDPYGPRQVTGIESGEPFGNCGLFHAMLSDIRRPARGFGRILLSNGCFGHPDQAVLIQNEILAATARAIVIDDMIRRVRAETSQAPKYAPIGADGIVRTASVFFEDEMLTVESAVAYRDACNGVHQQQGFGEQSVLRRATEIYEQSSSSRMLADLLKRRGRLILLILSLSRAGQPETWLDMPLSSLPSAWDRDVWNYALYHTGDEDLERHQAEASFEFTALCLDHHFDKTLLLYTSMISSHGWTILLPSVRSIDPSDVRAGEFFASAGVPSRYGVRKSGMVDGNLIRRQQDEDEHQPHLSGRTKADGAGTLTCRRIQEAEGICTLTRRPISSEEQRKLFSAGTPDKYLEMHVSYNGRSWTAGYRGMHDALDYTNSTRPCAHDTSTCMEVDVPLDCIALPGFTYCPKELFEKARVVIFRSAGNTLARWYSLCMADQRKGNRPPETVLLLRSRDCCLSCAIDQARAYETKCALIL